MNTPIKRVVVAFAMKEEAGPFIANCNLQRIPSEELSWPSLLPLVAYRGKVSSCEVFACWTGQDKRFLVNNVATTAASVAAYAAICEFKPDVVISAGTAGGFRSCTANIGDVYLSVKCIFHSRRIPSGAIHYEEYGFGHFRSPPLAGLAFECCLKMGVVSTSDSLDASPRDLELLRGEGAAVKEMEAAAIAWVCEQLHVPFFALKSITDIVDGSECVEEGDEESAGNTQDQFYRNLAKASANLQEKLVQVLRCLSGRTLQSWRNVHKDKSRI